MARVVLASASEGRKELFLAHFGGEIITQPMDIAEEECYHLPVNQMVEVLAQQKARACAQKYPQDIVFAFDTMVECDKKVLGKPETLDEAREMLLKLTQKEQNVWTGYSFKYKNTEKSGVEKATLILDLSPEEIESYIVTHPVTKFAGAYAVQKEDTRWHLISGTMDVVVGACMAQAEDFYQQCIS
ncbi:MAG: Maf family protein [Brevinema sp.]